MKSLGLAIALLAGTFGSAGACSSTVTEGDSESHFLATCPPGCTGGLTCVCGACTKACDSDGACGSLAPNATCVDHGACSTPKSCDVKCTTASDCSMSGYVCDHGLCRKNASRPEGGSGSQGGDASTGPKDGSSIPMTPDGDASLDRCHQPIDIRQCESSDLYVHNPRTNICKNQGAFWCANNDNGFASMAECLRACPGSGGGEIDGTPTTATPLIKDWDGGPFALADGSLQTCWFPGFVAWSDNGAVAGDRKVLEVPHFSRTSEDGKRTCYAPVPDCGAVGITPHDIGVALRDTDVRLALSGIATKPIGRQDGSGILLTIDDFQLRVGSACAGAPGCIDVPPGVRRLVDLLRQVEIQELNLGDCHPNPACYAPRDPGPCTTKVTRYAYNPDSGRCFTFDYGGCDGNENRFETEAACEQACGFDPCMIGEALYGDGGNPPTCSGTLVAEGNRCFHDPGFACGCACARIGRASHSCGPNDGGLPGISCL